MSSKDLAATRQQGRQSWEVLLGILIAGLFIYSLGGGIPPLAWQRLMQLLAEKSPSQTQLVQAYASLGCLLVAWGIVSILLAICTVSLLGSVFQALSSFKREKQPGAPLSKLPPHKRGQGVDASHMASIPGEETDEVPPGFWHPGGVTGSAEQESLLLPGSSIHDELSQLPFWSCTDPGDEVNSREVLYTDWYTGSGSVASRRGYFAVIDSIPAEDEHGQDAALFVLSALRDRIVEGSSEGDMSETAFVALLDEQVQHAMDRLSELLQQERQPLSIVVALLNATDVYLANVGDTRAYLYRPRVGFLHVTDQVGMYPKWNEQGPVRHITLGSTGNLSATGEISLFSVTGLPDDIVLFCSAGLWTVLPPTYIEQIIRATEDPAKLCNALLEATRKNGSRDPVSIIVLPL